MSVPSWLADTADAHLRELARSGRAKPLLWDRGRFLVRLTDTTRSPWVAADVEVPGLVSRPFFSVYRGTTRGGSWERPECTGRMPVSVTLCVPVDNLGSSGEFPVGFPIANPIPELHTGRLICLD